MRINKLYLDMDGVLCDFNKRYTEIFNVSPEITRDNKSFNGYFDKFIETKQFETLDLMPDAINLMNYLRRTGIPVTILSSTSSEDRDAEIRPQKLKWLKDHQIEFPVILVPGGHLKAEYATPDSLLIDDTAKVIDSFRRAGGIGILYRDYVSCIATLSMYT